MVESRSFKSKPVAQCATADGRSHGSELGPKLVRSSSLGARTVPLRPSLRCLRKSALFFWPEIVESLRLVEDDGWSTRYMQGQPGGSICQHWVHGIAQNGI